MQNLVIVESPTKARTLAKFLGSKYQIEASMGHIRDLPKSEFGVDIENNFEPGYVIPRDKRKKVNELKKLAKGANELWLATDPDREGEAIAWHLKELMVDSSGLVEKNKAPKTINRIPITIHRVEFHEITPEAIKEAFLHPREINMQLVDAQQARRVLDRIVGYQLSPLLWKKIKRGLSAGRVQSIALRLIVEREREIDIFKAVEYWSIDANLSAKEGNFLARAVEYQGKKLEIGSEKEAKEHLSRLEGAPYSIEKITEKQAKRYPAPPFTTSTLQQTAGNRLNLSAKKTMMLAQNLYEQGLITYMRTDSLNIASSAMSQTRALISKDFGGKYLPSTPRFFKSKSKNAQEAHEAIRPTNVKVTSEQIKNVGRLSRDHIRLYDLIWKRLVASQMSEAVFNQTAVDVTASYTPGVNQGKTQRTPGVSSVYKLRANGSVILFDGWLKLYGVSTLEEDPSTLSGQGGEEDNKKQILPPLTEGEDLKLLELLPAQHFTQPPPRYTEASLIKKLEELGIGRPSTYAPILSTIQDRFYVEKEERKFKPSALGMAVNDFLMKYFPNVFDYQFTAQMEDQLDEVSRGERKWKETISEFYTPFEKTLEKTGEVADKVKLEVEITDELCPKCGKNLVVRTGRFGKFLACSGFPECKYTQALEQLIDAKCPQDGGDIVVRKTKKGKTFYGCKNWPKCTYASWTKPKGNDQESKLQETSNN